MPNRTAKPDGVQGCQRWFFTGDTAPLDATGYAFLALDTRTPEREGGDGAVEQRHRGEDSALRGW
jgi:hypothetical protein